MKKETLPVLFNAFLALSIVQSASAQSGFTYQGKLTDDCCPATGLYDMVFRLYGIAGGGSPLATLPAMMAVPVTNGLFTASLGFADALFNGSQRWLQIEVRTNDPANPSASYATLLPRTELTPTPYAIYAGNAAALNGQSSSAFAPASGSFAYVAKAGDTMTGTLRLPANGLVAGANQLVLANGNLGVGTAIPETRLHIYGAEEGVRIQGPSPGALSRAYMTFTDSVGTRIGYVGDESSNDRDVLLDSDGGNVVLNTSAGRVLTATAAGKVGIGTAFPQKNLHVFGQGDVEIGLESGDFTGTLWTIQSSGDFSGNVGKFQIINRTAGASHLTITPGGYVGIGTTDPQAKLHVNGGILSSGASGDGVVGRAFTQNRSGVYGEHSGDGGGVAGRAYGPNGVGVYGHSVDPNGHAAVFDGRVQVNGNMQVCTLTIVGGCDLAEPFQLSSKEIPRGALVTIDEENAGQLKMSDHAYDTRVAGILSGANGINPGIQLHQEGALDGGQNVALSGRVYALADALEAPIKPGDLLTTSATPGHCMKVTEPAKAQGAIIGKAMSALAEGKGMVLVLVSLQ